LFLAFTNNNLEHRFNLILLTDKSGKQYDKLQLTLDPANVLPNVERIFNKSIYNKCICFLSWSNQILFRNITFFTSKQKEKYCYAMVTWHFLFRLPVTPNIYIYHIPQIICLE